MIVTWTVFWMNLVYLKNKNKIRKTKNKKQKNKSVIKVDYFDVSFDKSWDCSVVRLIPMWPLESYRPIHTKAKPRFKAVLLNMV